MKTIQEPRVHRLSSLFDPLNLLLILANLLVFVVVETYFFWNIASKTVDNVVNTKGRFVANVVKNKPDTHSAMLFYLDTPANTTELIEKTNQQRKEREDQNWELVKSMIAPAVYIIGGVCALVSLALIARRETVTSVDLFLLFCVVGAFSTEVVFYLLVITQLEYIGDAQIMEKIIVPVLEKKPV